MTTLVLCAVCDDAIGIYEPLVVLNGSDRDGRRSPSNHSRRMERTLPFIATAHPRSPSAAATCAER